MTLGLAIVMLLADTLIFFVLAVIISILKNGKCDDYKMWSVLKNVEGKIISSYLFMYKMLWEM